MLPGKSGGNCAKRSWRAFDPPVEIPMATTLVGSFRGREDGLSVGLAGSSATGTSVGRLRAAPLILAIRSRAIRSMGEAAASRGLATKSNAPRARALQVAETPSVVSAL